VFADVLLNPAFAADKMDSTRERQLAALQATQSDPFGQCSLYFDQQFFTASPYRFPRVGTPETIAAVTVEDLRDFYNRVRVGRNMVLAVSGDVDPAEVESWVRDRISARLQAGQPVEAPAGIKPRQVETPEIYVQKSDKPGTTVIVGYPGTDIYDLSDRVPMDVFDTVASGYTMPRGWLHDTLRGQSLVYAVHFSGRPGLLPGYYRAAALCQPDKATRVARLIEDLLASGRDYAYGDQELERARTTILTARQMERQTPEQIARDMTFDELYGLGYDFEEKYAERLRAVTADDVRRVARKFIGPPVICITTPAPELVDAEELRKPYDAAKLEAMRAETPAAVHQNRVEHLPPQ
jgi:zinc protease